MLISSDALTRTMGGLAVMDLSKWKPTWKDITPEQVAAAVGELMKERIGPIEARLAQLEADLDARAYKGVFDPAFTYKKHNQVSFHGCQWVAISDENLGEPGRSQGWQLSVKKGRDGRNAS
jgi:hypothetical protein